MGYKCLLCFEDFGKNKDAWEEHCKNEHFGIAKEVIDAIENEAEGNRTDNEHPDDSCTVRRPENKDSENC